jgi:COP9 signalosome complex subunit 1
LQPDLELDLHLHDHIEPLYTRIRNKALIQYFSPFISVDLNAMAAAFTTSVAGLEKELARLIMDGSISARIDSHNKAQPPKSSCLFSSEQEEVSSSTCSSV